MYHVHARKHKVAHCLLARARNATQHSSWRINQLQSAWTQRQGRQVSKAAAAATHRGEVQAALLQARLATGAGGDNQRHRRQRRQLSLGDAGGHVQDRERHLDEGVPHRLRACGRVVTCDVRTGC